MKISGKEEGEERKWKEERRKKEKKPTENTTYCNPAIPFLVTYF